MTGRITRLVLDRGFGFLRDEQDRDRFFHARDLRDVTLSELSVGDAVTFTPVKVDSRKHDGERAQMVRRATN